MKMINHMNIACSASLRLSGNKYGEKFHETCLRFFRCASILPDSTSLGLQIKYSKEDVPTVTVFSDAQLSFDDYKWMFELCAEVTEHQKDDIIVSSGDFSYSVSKCGSYYDKDSDIENNLTDELSKLDAILNIIVPSKSKYASLTLQTSSEIPFRVKVMLCDAFHGAEIKLITDRSAETEVGLLCDAVLKNLENTLSDIAEKSDLIGVMKNSRTGEEENETCTPIKNVGFSIRAYTVLRHTNINTLEQLRTMLKTMSREELKNEFYRHDISFNDNCLYEFIARAGLTDTENTDVNDEEDDFWDPDTDDYDECDDCDDEDSDRSESEADERSGLEMLNELIGLADVKYQVKRIAAFAEMQKDMKDRGMNFEPVTLNMAFIGNPGTAKTTVARILAKILYEAGILRNPKAIEVGRADLIGKYEGHTASIVKGVFEKAKGGLLFIDEAYSLIENFENAFGDEAINTLVQEMENNRADTVVVFAGYPKLMEEFLSRNPGLKSRVPFKIEFADYSVEEMLEIVRLESGRRGFSISEDAVGKISEICSDASLSVENGNGRFCRNLVENAILSYAERVYGENSDNSEKDCVFKAEDFSGIQIKKREKTVNIGFN